MITYFRLSLRAHSQEGRWEKHKVIAELLNHNGFKHSPEPIIEKEWLIKNILNQNFKFYYIL